MNKLLIIFLALATTISGNSQEWSLAKEKENIKVFTRKTEGKKIKELKIESRVKASLNSLVAILEDIETHPDWVFKCSSSFYVDKPSDDKFTYYVSVDFPFPATDRDMVIYYEREQDPVTKEVVTISTSASDKSPSVDKYIRITEFDSKYILTPQEDGWVDIVYFLESDPAGKIPAWMINLAIAKGPTETMKRMFEEMKKEKYINANVPGVEELH